jgi:hypothetical protein
MEDEPSETSGPLSLLNKLAIGAAIFFLFVVIYIGVSFVHSHPAPVQTSQQQAPQADQAKP